MRQKIAQHQSEITLAQFTMLYFNNSGNNILTKIHFDKPNVASGRQVLSIFIDRHSLDLMRLSMVLVQ